MLPLDLAQRAQGFVETTHPERPAIFGKAIDRNPGMNEGKTTHLLLRMRDQRHKRCAADKSSQEYAPPHGSLDPTSAP